LTKLKLYCTINLIVNYFDCSKEESLCYKVNLKNALCLYFSFKEKEVLCAKSPLFGGRIGRLNMKTRTGFRNRSELAVNISESGLIITEQKKENQ